MFINHYCQKYLFHLVNMTTKSRITSLTLKILSVFEAFLCESKGVISTVRAVLSHSVSGSTKIWHLPELYNFSWTRLWSSVFNVLISLPPEDPLSSSISDRFMLALIALPKSSCKKLPVFTVTGPLLGTVFKWLKSF